MLKLITLDFILFDFMISNHICHKSLIIMHEMLINP